MLLDLDYQKFQIANTEASIEIKPLSVDAYQKLIRLLSSMGLSGMDEDSAVEDGLKRLGDEKLLSLIQEIIPSHCTNLKGVELKESGAIREAKIEDLIQYGACIQFFFPVLMQLFSISTLSAEQEKDAKK